MGSVTTGVAQLGSGVGQRSAEDIGVPSLMSPLTQHSHPRPRKPPSPFSALALRGLMTQSAASAESGHIYGPAIKKKSPLLKLCVVVFVDVRPPLTVSLHGGLGKSR